MSMTNGTIQSNDVKIYYEIVGDASHEPLLLLNGGPGFPHEYLQEMRALAPFAQLVFYDQRGTGNSDKANRATYTIDANVEDLENLRRALGFERVRVLAHSWGGILAQAYILKYPNAVTKLILADTFSSIGDLQATFDRMSNAMPPETRALCEEYERAGLYKDGDAYPAEYQAALDIAYEPINISIPSPEYLQNSFARIAYDVYRTMWGEESEFRITGTLKDFDFYPRLHEIRVPTLVIAGASDMPTPAMAQKTVDAIPNAQLEIFEHSRHFPFLEEPEKFVQVVGEFLATQ
jgi:proline-specific peptidase